MMTPEEAQKLYHELRGEIEDIEESRELWIARAQKYLPRDPEADPYWEKVDECNERINELEMQIEALDDE